MILVSLHTKSSSMFHGKLFPPKMENPENEDIIIPVCTLLIAAGIQQYKGNDCGLDIRLPGETNIRHTMHWYKNYHRRTQVVSRTF